MKSLFRSLFILLILSLAGQTQEIDKDIRFHSGELDKIRREIAEFEKKIGETSNKEKSEIERLNEIDEEISLVRNLIFRLRQEEKQKQHCLPATRTKHPSVMAGMRVFPASHLRSI